MSRLALPLAFFLGIVVTAPAMGRIRDIVFDLLPPGRAVPILGTLVSLATLGVLIYALTQVRDRRLLRFGGMAIVVIAVVLQATVFQRGLPQTDVVERIHVLEYGLLGFLFYRALRPRADLSAPVLAVLWTALGGTLEEGVQWFIQARLGDIHDVALNAFSGVCGVVFGLSLLPLAGFRPRRPARLRQIGLSASLLLVAVVGFYALAHVGHVITDPEVGSFRSWHTAEELRAAAEDRGRRWADDPPTGLGLWTPEDYFLTEAAWYASHRNAMWEFGAWRDAWIANRTLEKYYAPFLELSSFATGTPHRYPDGMRATLEKRGRRHQGPVTTMSPVLAGRIRDTPNRSQLAWAVLPFAVGLWLLGDLAARTMTRRGGSGAPTLHLP